MKHLNLRWLLDFDIKRAVGIHVAREFQDGDIASSGRTMPGS